MSKKFNDIYAITDTKYTPYENIQDFLIPSFKGGIKILQLRDKILSDKDLKVYAIKIQTLCKKYGVLFIINDRYDLAIDIKADGLHLGLEDSSDKQFRIIRQSFRGIIGVSCYGDIDRAKKFQELGADYVAFGSCFSSSTKQEAKVISLDILKEAKETLDIPICAIGGINIFNIHKIKKYNIDMIAVISGLWDVEYIQDRAMVLCS